MTVLTAAQIREGLRNKDSLVSFLQRHLGFNTNPIFYEATHLRIPSYVAAKINSWWLLCSYPGKVPFQIHFAEIKEFTFYVCRDIVSAFLRSHPANYLFIFTEDYYYMFFLSAERSLEKRPYTWRPEPKYYWRQLFVDCRSPGPNELLVLDRLRIDPACVDSVAIYSKVIGALRFARSDVPEWFMPWYYRMGFSDDRYDRLRESGMI